MGTSYGLIEVSGVVAAIDSLDAMCKASDVSLVTWERKLGGRLVTLIVEGGVSDVKAAVDAAKNICEENKHILAASGVIAAPSEEIRKMVALSARRIQRKREQEAQAEAARAAAAAEANAADTAESEPTAGVNAAKPEASDGTAEAENASETTRTESAAGVKNETEAVETESVAETNATDVVSADPASEADTADATNAGETGADASDTAESADSEAKADNTGKPADQAKKNHRKK